MPDVEPAVFEVKGLSGLAAEYNTSTPVYTIVITLLNKDGNTDDPIVSNILVGYCSEEGMLGETFFITVKPALDGH